jgi:L-fucose mutarotase
MIKTTLIHPEILAAVAAAGHHSKILLADGHYPASSKRGPHSRVVHLNLSPGIVTISDVLKALLTAVPVDLFNTMGIPADDPYAKYGEPPVWAEFREIARNAGVDAPFQPIPKWDFYKAVESADHVLTVQTADTALWSNLLITIGVRVS